MSKLLILAFVCLSFLANGQPDFFQFFRHGSPYAYADASCACRNETQYGKLFLTIHTIRHGGNGIKRVGLVYAEDGSLPSSPVDNPACDQVEWVAPADITLLNNAIYEDDVVIAFGTGGDWVRVKPFVETTDGRIWVGSETSTKTLDCSEPLYPPTATTYGTSVYTQTTASVMGGVSDNGGAEITSRGFYYSTTNSNPTTSDGWWPPVSNAGDVFFADMTGLSPATTYYFTAYVENSEGFDLGGIQSFTTLEPGVGVPVVTTATPTNVGLTEATVGGEVVSDGGETVTARGVCWVENGTPTIDDDLVTSGSGVGSFSKTITGIECGKTYNTRAFAINANGTYYGGVQSFSTPDFSPLPYSFMTRITNDCGSVSITGYQSAVDACELANTSNCGFNAWSGSALWADSYSVGTVFYINEDECVQSSKTGWYVIGEENYDVVYIENGIIQSIESCN